MAAEGGSCCVHSRQVSLLQQRCVDLSNELCTSSVREERAVGQIAVLTLRVRQLKGNVHQVSIYDMRNTS
jgi:hypothetical protein